MSGLLSGLEKLGLKNLEEMDLYEELHEKKEEVKVSLSAEANVIKESDFLFDKTQECPVCYKQFKVKTMKVGKAKLSHTDMDLRPIYEHIEPLKYDVMVCPHCGYAALSRYFKNIAPSQGKLIKENISAGYQGNETESDAYTYEEALERYKLCLANAIVKRGKASEKAYICLKTSWLLRSQAESLEAENKADVAMLNKLKQQENGFLKNALEGFLAARQSEGYPMCGMDETTVDYIIAVLAMEFGQYDISSKIIAEIITSNNVSSRMKDKARDVKEQLIVKIKQSK